MKKGLKCGTDDSLALLPVLIFQLKNRGAFDPPAFMQGVWARF
jgi:hypothetical protein